MDIVEKVARALCIESNESPDREYQTSELNIVQTGNMSSMDYVNAPNWKKYEKEARRFIAASNAMKSQ